MIKGIKQSRLKQKAKHHDDVGNSPQDEVGGRICSHSTTIDDQGNRTKYSKKKSVVDDYRRSAQSDEKGSSEAARQIQDTAVSRREDKTSIDDCGILVRKNFDNFQVVENPSKIEEKFEEVQKDFVKKIELLEQKFIDETEKFDTKIMDFAMKQDKLAETIANMSKNANKKLEGQEHILDNIMNALNTITTGMGSNG
eukprot:TRINITY_DN80621_c0_g1_i1.p1 TRINITY_DN80621_c0_g1~~TRINITY_DN80621_c0_g1_i1.p1  ORF type:complete len:197 (-),score=49.00 TRINITY_DN80621_c0_g1_i1:185-775(-)